MTVLSLLAVSGALVFSWSDSLRLGLVGRVLLGIGMSCNLMGTFKLLTLWFESATFATLSGIVLAIGTVGNMAATTPLVLLIQGYGWRMAFSFIAGLNLLLVVVFFGIVRDRPRERTRLPRSTDAFQSLRDILTGIRRLLRMREYWIISSGTFFRYGTFAAFQTLWAGPYLMRGLGLGAVDAGNLILLINGGTILGSFTWGPLSDRTFKARRGVVVFSLFLQSIAFLLIGMLPSRPDFLVLASLFFTVGFSAGGVIVMLTHIKELMPIELAGTAMTGVNFFTVVGAGLFSQGLGTLMQRLYPQASRGPEAFRAAFVVCSVCLGLAAFLYLFTRDSRPT